MNINKFDSCPTTSRAITLLGSGVSPEQVAAAIGVTSSRISQLLGDPEFTARVAELRFESLQKHNLRDSQYDTLEDALISKLSDLLPLMMRPMEVLKAIQIINAAKRRGVSSPEQVINQQTVVNITLPTKAVTKFVTNINNQVIQAGEQQLLTIQSGTLMKESGVPLDKEQINESPNHQNNLPDLSRLSEITRNFKSNNSVSVAAQQAAGKSDSIGCFVPA